MSQLTVQEYTDTPEARQKLVAFMERTGPLATGVSWEKRLHHWWDENPFKDLHPYRGRLQRHGDQIVAFGGAIPTAYAWQGQPVPALIASTLRADPAYPKAGLAILMQMRHLGREIPLIQTTPIPKLQHLLDKMQARSEKHLHRHYFLMGGPAALKRSRSWPSLASGLTLITDPAHIQQVARPYQKPDRLEKWVSRESLIWQLRTPTRQQQFLGTLDARGTLHSYLILSPRHRFGLRFWDILESFSTRGSFTEVQALAGAIVREPQLLSDGGHLLTANPFSADLTWENSPSIQRRRVSACHYISLPPAMISLPKHSVLAEGDFVM